MYWQLSFDQRRILLCKQHQHSVADMVKKTEKTLVPTSLMYTGKAADYLVMSVDGLPIDWLVVSACESISSSTGSILVPLCFLWKKTQTQNEFSVGSSNSSHTTLNTFEWLATNPALLDKTTLTLLGSCAIILIWVSNNLPFCLCLSELYQYGCHGYSMFPGSITRLRLCWWINGRVMEI